MAGGSSTEDRGGGGISHRFFFFRLECPKFLLPTGRGGGVTLRPNGEKGCAEGTYRPTFTANMNIGCSKT
ncbi:hypothetical protein KP509_33G016400 [Ceratopteris richardii]|uniref:Uncharacterized protein n=1 Tax=Ceratopteris richardii TaxID=49495 RepID=A0A8T2QP72_CERRI|nr:hypothetical protein KP509_33G016400 [Ceratopteris richardii]